MTVYKPVYEWVYKTVYQWACKTAYNWVDKAVYRRLAWSTRDNALNKASTRESSQSCSDTKQAHDTDNSIDAALGPSLNTPDLAT